jgi:hypothetical protein
VVSAAGPPARHGERGLEGLEVARDAAGDLIVLLASIVAGPPEVEPRARGRPAALTRR